MSKKKNKNSNNEKPVIDLNLNGGSYEYMFEVAYTIEDESFGKLNVQTSANAWWMDRIKLEKVITGKKFGLNDEEACLFSGINKDKLDYFLKIHPHFSEFFLALPMAPRTQAKMTIAANLHRIETATWYAEHKMKDEFAKRAEHSGPGGAPIPIQQNTIISDLMKMTPEQRKAREDELEAKNASVRK